MPTISRVTDLKKDLTKELQTLAALLTSKQKLQCAVSAGITPMSLSRYTKGDIEEVRNLELAEKLIGIMKKIK